MYHPTTRLLTVLELLQSRGQMTGSELASRLEVDPRTLRRYVMMLQDLGIPVEAERGRAGGYYLRPGYKLPPMMFNNDEAVALTFGLSMVQRLGFPVSPSAVEGALAKIERVMPEVLQEQVRALQESIIFDVTPTRSAPSPAMVVELSLASRSNRRVWIRHVSWHGDVSEREFDPYGIVYHGGFWYTIGYCYLRQDIRTFRVDRIIALEQRDQTFARPSDFDAVAGVIRSIALTPGIYSIEVLLKTDIEMARASIPPSVALLEAAEEGVLLRCYVQDLDWFAHALAGLPFPFVVLQPDKLRDSLRDLAEKISKMV